MMGELLESRVLLAATPVTQRLLQGLCDDFPAESSQRGTTKIQQWRIQWWCGMSVGPGCIAIRQSCDTSERGHHDRLWF